MSCERRFGTSYGEILKQKPLAATEQVSKADLNRVAAYLQIVLHEEPQFAEEVEKLAREIEAGRKAEKGMTQINNDNSTGFQIGTATGTNYFGGTHNNHPATKPGD